MFKAHMIKLTLINENIDLGQIWVFSVRFSVYIDCPSVLSLNSHKLHKGGISRAEYKKIIIPLEYEK